MSSSPLIRDRNSAQTPDNPPKKSRFSLKRHPRPSKLPFLGRIVHTLEASISSEESQSSANKQTSFLHSRYCIITLTLSVVVIAAIIVALIFALPNRRAPGIQYPLNSPPFRLAVLHNSPDPAIINHNGMWYVFATNSGAGILGTWPSADSMDSKSYQEIMEERSKLGAANIQVAMSTNFVNWTLHDSWEEDPLPIVGEWVDLSKLDTTTDASAQLVNHTIPVRSAAVWAPDILQRPSDGKFIMYYSAATSIEGSRTHCIGAATSPNITGPYSPRPDTITCPYESGGAIDATPIVDKDGSIYIAYKIDGNSMGNGGECGNTIEPLQDTPILLQRLDADGITPLGEPATILHRESSDGPLVEAPALARSDEGIYFLFFSSGCTRAPSYDVRYATSTKIEGPYTRAKDPLLTTGSWGLMAPGSVSVKRHRKKWRMAFHARTQMAVGGVRAIYTVGLILNGTTVTLVEDVGGH